MLVATGLASAAPGTRDAQMDAQVAYWTSGYTGAEYQSCKAPAVPALSRTNQEIRAIARTIADWEGCQNAYMKQVRAAATLEGRVQPEVLAAMTPAEREQAGTHVAAVHARLVEAADGELIAGTARHGEWLVATNEYVRFENEGYHRSRMLVARNELSERRDRAGERAAWGRRRAGVGAERLLNPGGIGLGW
ncbi:hypothetical protein G4G28_15000 [Massilia sp. Dwa41.01b]|uniref:hypothetical protein n=1 Tax=Massilia sp. Dwa41.01b TaxID=2709302 RepID=UPI0016034186|nr:hypothetical protein [Massilia sp. Dwa41.01b]QNA89456.1 hypothetical protein G4G28_15000 [Massilia sp. Dwa41.01b]